MSLHTLRRLPSPEPRPKLRVDHDAEDPGMHAESEVVESDGRLGRQRVTDGILGTHDRRVEKDARADGVTGESKDVQEWKVRQKAFSRAALVVEPGLRVE